MTYHARGRDIVSLLEYEAFRRPEIAEFLDGIASVDDAAIDAFPVPLPWYRKAMKILRDRKNYAKTIRRDREGHRRRNRRRSFGDCLRISWTRPPSSRLAATTCRSRPTRWCSRPMPVVLWIDQIFSRVADPRLMAQALSSGQ
jgi:hypothetical protein